MIRYRQTGGTLALAASTIIGAACGLESCAVGPNFQAPQAPHTTGFVPPGELPAETTITPLAGGTAQHFVDDLDIQGQWWTLFQSPELNALIQRGLANNPTLEAASAALRQDMAPTIRPCRAPSARSVIRLPAPPWDCRRSVP